MLFNNSKWSEEDFLYEDDVIAGLSPTGLKRYEECGEVIEELVIPEKTSMGENVTKIKDGAFKDKKIFKLLINNENLTEIGKNAFKNCGIKKLELNEDITTQSTLSIDEYAFANNNLILGSILNVMTKENIDADKASFI